MAGTFDISTINVISPNGLVTKSLTVDDYGYAKIGDERVGITPQNWIINGMFDVWQRGTSQTNSLYGSSDRWLNFHTVSTKTTSRQEFAIGQTEVPNNPTYYQRTVVTSGGTADSGCNTGQRIEDVKKLSGKTVSLSFWAKSDSNRNASIEFAQHFGIGGSTSVDKLGITKISLTTSWQRFTKTVSFPSVSGKTIGADNFSLVRIWFDAGSNLNANTDSLGNQSGTFDIANVCLVEGSVPVECPNEPYGEVLRKCQRYYQRIKSEDHLYTNFGSGYAVTVNALNIIIKYPVTMRVAPTSIETSAMSTFYYDPIIGNTPTSIVGNNISKDGLLLTVTKTSGFTANSPYALYSYNTLSAYIGFSAEL